MLDRVRGFLIVLLAELIPRKLDHAGQNAKTS